MSWLLVQIQETTAEPDGKIDALGRNSEPSGAKLWTSFSKGTEFVGLEETSWECICSSSFLFKLEELTCYCPDCSHLPAAVSCSVGHRRETELGPMSKDEVMEQKEDLKISVCRSGMIGVSKWGSLWSKSPVAPNFSDVSSISVCTFGARFYSIC